jgi:hypothetical protein
MTLKFKKAKDIQKGDYIRTGNIFTPVLEIDDLGTHIYITHGDIIRDTYQTKINKEFYCEVLEETK